jgi:thioredoxin-like negative regulator of GroEL
MLVELLLLLATSPANDPSGIRWIDDDWQQAKKTAIEKNQLIAVDVWATWCHTCLSMKNYTLKEARFAGLRDRMTWLMLDFDNEKNASFFQKFPTGALPTFLVIDPKTDSVVSRWVGSGTAEEMLAFFGGAKGAGDDALARGQRALGTGDVAGARKIFETALAKEKLDRATKTRIVNGLIEALWKLDHEACVRQGERYLTEVDDSVQGLDAIALISYCAEEQPLPVKKRVLAQVAKRLDAATADPTIEMSVDDRSSYLETLVEAYATLGDQAKSDAAAKAQLALLEKAAAEAKTDAVRATFDYHRVNAYLRAKRYDDAIGIVSASEKAQPKDFNHPWRLAIINLKKGDYDRGLLAIERALKNGYGGRKLRLYSTKLDLLIAKKDLASARQTVAAAEREMERIDPSQLRPSWKKEFDSKVKQVQALETKS